MAEAPGHLVQSPPAEAVGQPLWHGMKLRGSNLSILLPSNSPKLTGRPGPSHQGWDGEPKVVARPQLPVQKLYPEGADRRSEGKPWVSQEGPVSFRVAG